MPEVSVIIPVYNSEKYVEKCICSVMAQTLPELEIIIINDGSIDESGKILRKLAQKDSRIILLEQENKGVAAARNLGVEKATGNVDEGGKELNKIIPGVYKRLENEEWTFRISAVCSHLYKRELWEKYDVKFQSGERGEDMPVSLLFSAVCPRIATLPECGYYYVQHASSAIHNFKGLEKYSLPYKGLENTLTRVNKIGIQNSPEFYELFVLRIFATCLFQLAPGARWEKIRELCDYISCTVNTYFPTYWKNSKAKLNAKVDIPFTQKAAVKVLQFLLKTKLLRFFGRLISKKK